MKEVAVEKAIGTVLAHDLTQIIPGQFKGSRYKKGHIIQPEDIDVLLSMGKKHIYILEKSDQDLHEDEAALRIARAVTGAQIEYQTKGEGKIEMFAEEDGLLKINRRMLERVVEDDQVVLATVHENRLVKKGDKIAATRVIPLFIKEQSVKRVEEICKDTPILEVRSLQNKKVAVVTTGSEVYSGLIEDKFGPVLVEKFQELGSTVVQQVFSDDDEDMIAGKIREMVDSGAEFIAVTGGMSVDPDDRTPMGIRKAGGEIITYGASVLPGAMFMLAYIGNLPVVGLPGCVMYVRTSIFDLIVPRILTGEIPTKKEIKKLAYGGLCLSCPECTYPQCGFGR